MRATRGRLVAGSRPPGGSGDGAGIPIVTEVLRDLEPTTADPFIDNLETSPATAVRAREQERRRLSRDLHDGVGATLSGLIMVLGAARARASGAPRELLAELERDLVEVVAELRLLIDELRPPALRELGLAGALRYHADRIAAGGLVDVTVTETPGGDRLPAVVELAAYRIAAEALTNVGRHARASRCELAIARSERELRITVRDDGIGLVAARPGRIGISTMRERAAELGGRVEWHVAEGGGTLVECDLPFAS